MTILAMGVIFWGAAWAVTQNFAFWQGKSGLTGRVPLTSDEYFDLTRSAVTFGGAFAIGATLLLAYRRQSTTDSLFELERRKETVDAERELRSRFGSVTEQLGHDKSASRLAGLYALAALADDWFEFGNEDERQVCVDVLCAYLRLPYDPESDLAKAGEREVRFTAVTLIRDHLRAPNPAWKGCSFDFTGATFDGGSLQGMHLDTTTSMDFSHAHFSTGTFDFSGLMLGGATLTFRQCDFQNAIVTFAQSTFKLGRIDFSRAKLFNGELVLSQSKFSGAAIIFAAFGLHGGKLNLFGSDFSGGRVSFYGLKLIAGVLDFFLGKFNGSEIDLEATDWDRGQIRFNKAVFTSGLVTIDNRHPKFSAEFKGATGDSTLIKVSAHPISF